MSVFERYKHLYVSPDFDKIIKDTIRFFNQTPVQRLSEKSHLLHPSPLNPPILGDF